MLKVLRLIVKATVLICIGTGSVNGKDYKPLLEECRNGNRTACWKVTDIVGYGNRGSNYRVSAEAFFMQCEIEANSNRKSSDCSLALLELERFDKRLVKREMRYDCLDLRAAPQGFKVLNKCTIEKDERLSFDVCHAKDGGQDSIDYFFGRITNRQSIIFGAREYVCDKRSSTKPSGLGSYRLPSTNNGFEHSLDKETQSIRFGKNILMRVGMLYIDQPWRSLLPQMADRKNEITKKSLNNAVHHHLQAVSGATDRVFGGNAGFAYSCDGNICTAMGGIVTYRYYVTQVQKCEYASDVEASCKFRMGLDVQSALKGNASEIGNKLLAGFGSSANIAVHEARLKYVGNEWKLSNPPGIICTTCN